MTVMRSIFGRQARICLRSDGGCWRAEAAMSSGRWSSTNSREFTTPLAKQLTEAITATGPIPLATYMRMCLTSDMGGYYTSEQSGKDQFGVKGDFITSPEISQIFGELIAVWFVAEWQKQKQALAGKTPVPITIGRIDLIEIGPGRGTLMDDMMRTFRSFRQMAVSIDCVWMVEASPALREAQHKLLCDPHTNPLEKIPLGYRSKSKHVNIPIIWVENLRDIPNALDKVPFIVAHEFFDALPIHAFQSVAPAEYPTDSTGENPIGKQTIQTPTGEHEIRPRSTTKERPKKRQSPTVTGPQWREMVVSPTPPDATHTSLKTPKSQQSANQPPEFQLTLSKASTPHSLYLPEISERYQALKKIPGSTVEISPESHSYMAEIARRIGGTPKSRGEAQYGEFEGRGAAIILDYGTTDTIPTNSLRGIKEHQRVSPFSQPGKVDLSADVDFTALAEAAINASKGSWVVGPIDQGLFLNNMGIQERAEALMKGIYSPGKKARIEGACKRLVDMGPDGMGKVYKVMVVVPYRLSQRTKNALPVGFGGSVASGWENQHKGNVPKKGEKSD